MRPALTRICGIIALNLCLCFSVYATHIVGGQITYKYLSLNTYSITLRLFRDANSTTPYDNPTNIYIYDAVTYALVDSLGIPYNNNATKVNLGFSNPCATVPSNLNIEEADFTGTATLPANTHGFYIVYQRCCRNGTIINIVNPGGTGATYIAYIPPTSLVAINSSPYFKNDPPLVICANFALSIDMSAIDPDGDSLVYSMWTPYDGASAASPLPINGAAAAPPYTPISWGSTYSVSDEVHGTPNIAIDSKTGLLTGYPCCLGIYLVGICVKEYRHGVFLSQTNRDFQFDVTSCTPAVNAAFTSTTDTGSLGYNTISKKIDTITLCGSYDVLFNNGTHGSLSSYTYYWNFGDPKSSVANDTSTTTNPAHQYPDTGYYNVWLYVNRGLTCHDSTLRVLNLRYNIHSIFTFDTVCVTQATAFTDHSYSNNYYKLSNWSWNFGDGDTSNIQNPTHMYALGGTYPVSLKVTDKYGCSARDSNIVEVLAQPTSFISFGDSVLCYRDSIRLSAIGGVSYTWSPNYHISSLTIADPIIWPRVDTQYIARIVDKNGCVRYDTSKIHVVDTVIAKIWHDTTVCQLSPVQLRDSGAFKYKWRPGKSLNDSLIANPIATPDSTTLYYCYASIGSCHTVDTVIVHTKLIPTLTTNDSGTINQGRSFQLKATSNAFAYLWTPAGTLSSATISAPEASPLNTTTYYVTVTGKDGCTRQDSVLVYVTHIHKLFLPNAFSPNGDGLNDKFQFFTEGIKELKDFRIYNRWGQCVFKTNNLNEFWDGKYKGEPESLGVFEYYIEAVTFDGDTISQKGNITLLK